MEQIQATSIFSLLETNKSQRASFVNQVIEALQEGQVNPLKLHHQVKCMEQLLADLKERPEYKEMLIEEATKHGKKFEMHNAEFQIKEAGVKYDYSKCGDADYDNMIADKAILDAKIKAREALLKQIPDAGLVNPDDGVIINKPVKTSTTTVQVTLK